jgi:hypothetical protein
MLGTNAATGRDFLEIITRELRKLKAQGEKAIAQHLRSAVIADAEKTYRRPVGGHQGSEKALERRQDLGSSHQGARWQAQSSDFGSVELQRDWLPERVLNPLEGRLTLAEGTWANGI